MCVQQKVRSDWTYTQSDYSLRLLPPEEDLGSYLPDGRFASFVMLQLSSEV